jgi:hypothetical protein
MITLAFNSCSDDYVAWSSLQNQEANVVITAEPESQRGHHCRIKKPTWSSLQEYKPNVVIIAGPESQSGHH